MALTESIVEDAALEWSLLRPALRDYGGQVVWLGYGVGHGASYATLRRAKPQLAPGEPSSRDGGRDSFSEVVLVGRLRGAIRRLNPARQPRTLATLRDPAGAGLPKRLSGESSVANEISE